MYEPKHRTQKEIDDLLNDCVDAEMTGQSKYPGMSYEEGIAAAINWLLDTGSDDEHPLAD